MTSSSTEGYMLARWASINVLLAALAPLSATAQDGGSEADRARAYALFERAETEYAEGDLEEAERLLAEALEIFHEPALLYNLARAREGLGRTEQAIEGYRAYLAEVPDAPNRGAIERRIEAMQASMERERRAEADRARERERRAADDGSPLVVPLVIGATGLAVLGAGAVLGGLAVSERDAAVEAGSHLDGTAAFDRGETFATVANVLFAAGGAALAVGVVWVIVVLAAGDDETDEALFGDTAVANGAPFHLSF
jgi:tetratricopeptide (TPR) repeat protein